jgi:hypothetical protein
VGKVLAAVVAAVVVAAYMKPLRPARVDLTS